MTFPSTVPFRLEVVCSIEMGVERDDIVLNLFFISKPCASVIHDYITLVPPSFILSRGVKKLDIRVTLSKPVDFRLSSQKIFLIFEENVILIEKVSF